MKKTFPLLLLFIIFSVACNKSKPTEIEMMLPTPIPNQTSVMVAIPTLAPSPTETNVDLHYTIEDIQGTVLVSSEDSTVPESAAVGEPVELGDELITKDRSEATLALNDNTMIHLSANTHVKVADLSSNQTNGFTSRLELLRGNILSEVEKLNESRSSFEVEAGGVVCGVRGTAFEVQKQGTEISTSTFHGIVEMQKDGHVQKVGENQHSTYSLKRSGFLKQRPLNVSERKHYQTWTKKRMAIQAKRNARMFGHKPARSITPKKTNSRPKKAGAVHKRPPAVKQNKNHHPAHKTHLKTNLKKPTMKQPRKRPRPKIKKSYPQLKPKQSTQPALRRAQPKPKKLNKPQNKKTPPKKRKPNL